MNMITDEIYWHATCASSGKNTKKKYTCSTRTSIASKNIERQGRFCFLLVFIYLCILCLDEL